MKYKMKVYENVTIYFKNGDRECYKAIKLREKGICIGIINKNSDRLIRFIEQGYIPLDRIEKMLGIIPIDLEIEYLDNYNLEKWGELKYAKKGDSGFDLRAAIKEPLVVYPLKQILIPCGIKFNTKPGFEIQIRPRSGLSIKQGIIIVNSPGTVDSGFRGEVKVILTPLKDAYEIYPGDRIAQAVVSLIPTVELVQISCVSETERGESGYGSSGRN